MLSRGGEILERVIKYRCSRCGKLFDTEDQCNGHEDLHKRITKANIMLDKGYTLQEINDACNIWYSVPTYLQKVNKDNCFRIDFWQCCSKPAYRIDRILINRKIRVYGCGSWSGYYGDELSLSDGNLKDPRPKEELFVDPRYENKWYWRN